VWWLSASATSATEAGYRAPEDLGNEGQRKMFDAAFGAIAGGEYS